MVTAWDVLDGKATIAEWLDLDSETEDAIRGLVEGRKDGRDSE